MCSAAQTRVYSPPLYRGGGRNVSSGYFKTWANESNAFPLTVSTKFTVQMRHFKLSTWNNQHFYTWSTGCDNQPESERKSSHKHLKRLRHQWKMKTSLYVFYCWVLCIAKTQIRPVIENWLRLYMLWYMHWFMLYTCPCTKQTCCKCFFYIETLRLNLKCALTLWMYRERQESLWI